MESEIVLSADVRKTNAKGHKCAESKRNGKIDLDACVSRIGKAEVVAVIVFALAERTFFGCHRFDSLRRRRCKDASQRMRASQASWKRIRARTWDLLL